MRHITLTCLLFMVALVGCGPSEDNGGSSIKGNIAIDGSSTVQPIANAIQKRFNKTFADVEVRVEGRGTGNGFKKFQDKETDISEASRPIKGSEFDKVKKAGIEFIELPVAFDGLTIVVNKENDWVKKLDIKQLRQIFLAEGAAKKWSDVDPTWPKEEIKLNAPGTGSGTYDYFKEVVATVKENGKKVHKEIREDMSLNEDDNILVNAVASNKYAIGFFGVAYYIQNKEKLQAVPIVNPKDNKAYLPESKYIESNSYAPFSRPLFIYVSTESLKRAEVNAFVEYYLENAAEVAPNVGYVQLPQELSDRAMEVFNNPEENVGTCYVTEDGKKRSGTLSSIYTKENRTK